MRWLRQRYFADLPDAVVALTGVSFCVALGFGIVTPIIPVFAKSFHVSALAATAVISVFAAMRFVSAGPAGWLVNRFGERTVLWVGLAIVAASSALAGLAHTYPQLLVLRGLGGTGSSMFTVSAMSLLLRVVDTQHRGRATARYQSGFLIGGLAGPAVGGIVVAVSIRAPFFVYAATLIAASWVARSRLPRGMGHPEHDPHTSVKQDPSMPLRAAITLPEYWTALMLNLTTGMTTFGLRSALLPLYVTEALRRGPSLISVGFLVGSVVQAAFLLPSGSITDGKGRKPALLVGSLALAVAMILLMVSETIPAFFGYMALAGCSAAFLSAGSAAVIGDIVSGRKGGPVVSTYQMTSDFGMVVGPLLTGYLRDVSGGYFWPFAFSTLITVALVALVARMPETRTRHYLRAY